MKRYFRINLTLLIFLPLLVNAANRIEFVAGMAKPPFILESGQVGLQIDIVRKALACTEHTVYFINVPLARNLSTFQHLKVDGILTVPSTMQSPGLFVSKPYIYYENVIVTLKENNLQLTKLADLASLKIAAFQNAAMFLGNDYKKATEQAVMYREVANQNEQIALLFDRKVDAIVLDRHIFQFFIKNHTEQRFTKEVDIHRVFEQSGYAAAFKSNELKELFDQGIECIKADGSYQKIFEQYLLTQN